MKVLSIHLLRFSELKDFEQLVIDNDLINLDAQQLYDFSNDGYTKVFVDSDTHKIIGLVHHSVKKEVIFSNDFITDLKNLPSLTIKSREVRDTSEHKRDYLDYILDKISTSGIESLSKKEKKYLDDLKS
jgi:hypothetical protein